MCSTCVLTVLLVYLCSSCTSSLIVKYLKNQRIARLTFCRIFHHQLMKEIAAISAPGKAFIAGGYLVLDPAYEAYVVALSSRMHAVVRTKDEQSVSKAHERLGTITVLSPQFNGKWQYVIDSGGDVVQEGEKNPFLRATVETCMKYVAVSGAVSAFDMDITIYSDPGFHTAENTTVKTSANGKKLFLFHPQKITDVAKTGLGSSASLVSVVTTAIMTAFNGQYAETRARDHVLHNLAQVAHCKAQQKIGSGFDVATAIYGSIRYRRFEPELIDGYLQDPGTHDIKSLVERQWDFTHDACGLPPHIRLLMGDIKGGSETPKLVSIVLNWKNQHPDQCLQLYTQLNGANRLLMDALTRLHQYYASDKPGYLQQVSYLQHSAVRDIDLENVSVSFKPFGELIAALKLIRRHLKQLTHKTGADIEPDSQTELLDNCNELKGCLGGVVPGAGGYDAISLLVVDQSIDSIIDTSITDDRFKQVSWLNLREQAEGLVVESPHDYKAIQ